MKRAHVPVYFRVSWDLRAVIEEECRALGVTLAEFCRASVSEALRWKLPIRMLRREREVWENAVTRALSKRKR